MRSTSRATASGTRRGKSRSSTSWGLNTRWSSGRRCRRRSWPARSAGPTRSLPDRATPASCSRRASSMTTRRRWTRRWPSTTPTRLASTTRSGCFATRRSTSSSATSRRSPSTSPRPWAFRPSPLRNFTWDWIYETHPGFADRAPHVLESIRRAYRRATRALELPFGAGFDVFPRVQRVPLVARRPTRARAVTRAHFGLPATGRVALLSFGGYGLPSLDLAAVDCLGDWTIVTTDRTAYRGRDGRGHRRVRGRVHRRRALRRSGRRRGRRDHQARLRHHRRVHFLGHGDAVHVARIVPRVRPARV